METPTWVKVDEYIMFDYPGTFTRDHLYLGRWEMVSEVIAFLPQCRTRLAQGQELVVYLRRHSCILIYNIALLPRSCEILRSVYYFYLAREDFWLIC